MIEYYGIVKEFKNKYYLHMRTYDRVCSVSFFKKNRIANAGF